MTHRLPYPGLRAFRSDEADLFFGRDRALDSMIETLARTRFLAVIGSSGSGKSSLVRTGLLQSLSIGHYHKAGSNWRVADMHPGGRPLYNLAAALLTAAEGPAEMADADVLAAYLARAPRSIVNWVEAGNVPAGSNLLILADQFEELFRYANYAEREEAEAFTRLLLECRAAPEELGIHVVLTMRSEFLGACTLLPGLGEAINDGLFLTPRMTREECQEAIEGPAMMLDFEIEPRLVNRILNDLANFAPWERDPAVDQLEQLSRRADQLPLMQHTLNRLWQAATVEAALTFYEGWDAAAAEEPPPIVLTHDQYERIGGLRGALNAHAEELVAALPQEAQRLVPVIFKALVDGPSVADAVRRPCTVAELVALANGDWTRVSAVLDAFRAPDGNFLRPALPAELDNDTIIDLTHESLIRQWDSLAVWVEEEAASAATWHRLMSGQARHRDGKADLLVGLELANCRSWWDAAQPTGTWAERHGGRFLAVKRYLDDSIEADQERRAAKAQRRTRDRRRVKVFVSVLAVLTVFSSASALYAISAAEERDAERQSALQLNHVLDLQNRRLQSMNQEIRASEETVQARLREMSDWLQQISDIIRDQEQRPILGFDETERRLLDVLHPFQQYLLAQEPGVIPPLQVAQTLYNVAEREASFGSADFAMTYYRQAMQRGIDAARRETAETVSSELIEVIGFSAARYAWYLINLDRTSDAEDVLFAASQVIDSLPTDRSNSQYLRARSAIANVQTRLFNERGNNLLTITWNQRAADYMRQALEIDPNDHALQTGYLIQLYNQYAVASPDDALGQQSLDQACSFLDQVTADSELPFITSPVHRVCVEQEVNLLSSNNSYVEARDLLLSREQDIHSIFVFSPDNLSLHVSHLRALADLLEFSRYREEDENLRLSWLERSLDEIDQITENGAVFPVNASEFEFAIDELSNSIEIMGDSGGRLDAYTRLWRALSDTTEAYPQLRIANLVAGNSALQAANLLIDANQLPAAETWFNRADASFTRDNVLDARYTTEDTARACGVYEGWIHLHLLQDELSEAITVYHDLESACSSPLERYPWDYNLRLVFINSNMMIGDALFRHREIGQALPYLEYASHWGERQSTLQLAVIYRDGLLGEADPERAQELEALAQRQTVAELSIPATGDRDEAINVDIVVREWPEDYPYDGIDDWALWLEEMRDITIPQNVRDTFRRLHQYARENGRSFPEMAAFALEDGGVPPEPEDTSDP